MFGIAFLLLCSILLYYGYKVLSKYKLFVALVSFIACVFAAGIDKRVGEIKTLENSSFASASVSACIEMGAVANQIEITKISIKRAAIKAIGMTTLYSINEDASHHSCSVKLV